MSHKFIRDYINLLKLDTHGVKLGQNFNHQITRSRFMLFLTNNQPSIFACNKRKKKEGKFILFHSVISISLHFTILKKKEENFDWDRNKYEILFSFRCLNMKQIHLIFHYFYLLFIIPNAHNEQKWASFPFFLNIINLICFAVSWITSIDKFYIIRGGH